MLDVFYVIKSCIKTVTTSDEKKSKAHNHSYKGHIYCTLYFLECTFLVHIAVNKLIVKCKNFFKSSTH